MTAANQKKGKLVQKSNTMIDIVTQTNFTLSECKILDIYLARVNTHDSNNRTVSFTKTELEELIGVQKINLNVLLARMDHIQSQKIKIIDGNGELRNITLFEEAHFTKDRNNCDVIELECTQKAATYIFNIENLGYIRYALSCILGITSKTSYIMFLYLKKNAYRKEWTVSVENLRKILGCESVSSYRIFKDFNKCVLKKSQKELQEKTGCTFTYQTIRSGKSVSSIKFSEVKFATDKGIEAAVPDPELKTDVIDVQFQHELWEQAVEDFQFSEAELTELNAFLKTIPTYELPESTAAPGNRQLMEYHYMLQKATLMQRMEDQGKHISNKFGYLLKVLKQDAKG